MKKIFATSLAFLFLMSFNAWGQVVDFEDVPFGIPAAPFNSQGMNFTASAGGADGIFTDDGVGAENGTQTFGYCGPCGPQVITATLPGGTAFNVTSIDAGNLTGFAPGMTIDLVGNLSGGGTVTQSLVVVADVMTTYPLVGFTNIVSLEISSPLADGNIDNLVYAPAGPPVGTIVDFEDVIPGTITPFNSRGMDFVGSAGVDDIFPPGGGGATNGTQTFGWCGSACGPNVITASLPGGTPFNVTSIDAGDLFLFAPPGMTVELVGNLNGGGIVTQSLVIVPGVITTYPVIGFNNLVSLEITCPAVGLDMPDAQIDNLVYSTGGPPPAPLFDLVGITGSGGITPESLFFLSQTDASATFIMNLPNTDGGATIGFNPTNNFLYHSAGLNDGFRLWNAVNLYETLVVANGQFTGPNVFDSNNAITFNPATGTFLVADFASQFFDASLSGTATLIGNTPEQLKGLAFSGGTLYGVASNGGTLYELDPANGGAINAIGVLLDGNAIDGMNGLATHPTTGQLWGIFRQAGARLLGRLDPVTGFGTSVGVLPDNFAGLAFTTPAGACVCNGSFETGDFTGWIAVDMASPFEPLDVLPAATPTQFFGFGPNGNIVIPSDGGFAANNGFDGDGPDVICLAQDVGIIGVGDTLTFDYRLAWDMFNFGGSTLGRLLEVHLEPAGGGPAINVFPVFTAPAGTDSPTLFGGPNDDTGPLSASIDLTPFAGTDARIKFVWTIPEAFTGPGNAQLDNVAIAKAKNVIVDGSFESGPPLPPEWNSIEAGIIPLLPLDVYPAGLGLFTNVVTPTDGTFAAATVFDPSGGGPGVFSSLFQDIGVIETGDVLNFDYRAAWDNMSGPPWFFDVVVGPAGGGPPVGGMPLLFAPGGFNPDTGPLSGSFDLTPFAGLDARISFIWTFDPGSFGFGESQVDNVSLNRSCKFDLGDVNRDGVVNLLDVDPFIAVLASGTYQREADCNNDCVVNLLDVNFFIAILGGG